MLQHPGVETVAGRAVVWHQLLATGGLHTHLQLSYLHNIDVNTNEDRCSAHGHAPKGISGQVDRLMPQKLGQQLRQGRYNDAAEQFMAGLCEKAEKWHVQRALYLVCCRQNLYEGVDR